VLDTHAGGGSRLERCASSSFSMNLGRARLWAGEVLPELLGLSATCSLPAPSTATASERPLELHQGFSLTMRQHCRSCDLGRDTERGEASHQRGLGHAHDGRLVRLHHRRVLVATYKVRAASSAESFAARATFSAGSLTASVA
jgi:hypothetical protein